MAEKKGSANTPTYESQESLYHKAIKKMDADKLIVQYAFKEENYLRAAAMFEEVGEYLDAPQKAEQCRKLAKETKEQEKASIYQKALQKQEICETVKDYEKLSETFAQLGDYKDAVKAIENCRKKAEEIRRRKKVKRTAVLASAAVCAALMVAGWKVGVFRYVSGHFYGILGKNEKAAQIFTDLNGLFDSDAQAEDYLARAEKEQLEKEKKALIKAKPGDEFAYGTHTWKVLKREGDQVYMIATQVTTDSEFYHVPFHHSQSEVDWENSSLRAWLNSDVLENCFSEEERSRLILMTVEPSDNVLYGVNGGNQTQDYLSILSAQEAEEYLDILNTLGLDYWLRTPGNKAGTQAYLSAGHSVMEYGYPVSSDILSVRPVILVDCSELKEEENA